MIAPVDVGRAEPEIPVQARGRGLRRWSASALRPDGPVRPRVHVAHRSDGPAADELHDAPAVIPGVALIAHLRDKTGIVLREPLKDPALPHRPGKRLLNIDVQAALHRHLCGDGVVMIGRGDQNRLDVLSRIEHATVVGEPLGLVIGGFQRFPVGAHASVPVKKRASDPLRVGVGEGDDVLSHKGGHVAGSHAAGADRSDVHAPRGWRTLGLGVAEGQKGAEARNPGA